ncbi:3-keto-disaccharide hydrolase [Seonamhaeicola maritimus]|uniref:3-keto-disaccharide hydrolase n=1 Tax=Seonamhaeicola maritimus TaxID=2591822 RepID=UPI002495719C|nr:DUF1080 domain-containing protein [Seonamhaeicola maritimus]
MKAFFPIIIFVLVLVSCSTSKKEHLFNGENLEGWTIFVSDSTVNPNNYFYVNNGMIETVGVPIGYLRTTKEYSNYKLHVEWRYPEVPTNSGVFVHTSGDDLIWVGHYQGQLKHENAGDFIVHGVGRSATLEDSTYTSTTDHKPLISKYESSSESLVGEWNSYDIICKGDTIELMVNGVLQNVATNCSVTKGSIGLQAEGSKIQFRNLWVEPLD